MASYIISLLAVAGLSQVTAAQDNITSDAYFYGQSPAVYPSPPTTGTGAWADAVKKAQAFVGQLTQEEKSNLTCGGPITTGCGGMISAIPRMGFQGMCMQDGAHGVHSADFVNSYASGISVGASWNSELAYQRGYFMGGEFRTKGANVMLGPVVGPLGRVAVGGRNWEGFSNDPYLSGALAAATVEAVQGRGVITSTKHFIGNEQETNRNPTNPDGVTVSAGTTNFTGTIASVSSNIDDRTLHELYLWPFADAVRAGTGNIMASYNRLNNSYATQNSKILNGLLKTELGFQGFVISDWDAQHTGVASALAGLDMAMPSCYDYWGSNLTASIDNGTMPQSRLDDMATRIIAAWYLAGQDKNYTEPGVGLVQDFTKPHKSVNAKVPAAKPVVLSGAIEGHVLVKNIRNALPLRKPQLLSLFGYDALVSAQNNPSIYFEDGFESAQDTITAAARALGINLGNATLSQIADGGTLVLGGGSGANSPSYISAPYDAIVARAYEDDTSVFWDANTTVPTVDASSDACLVFINAFSTEGTDRTGLHDDYSDALVKNTANVCSNTIVVIHNAGVRLVDQWADHENVTAIIFGHLPGQDSGRALVSLLYGDVSFSGKLPYTVPKNESDFGPLESPSLPDAHTLFPQSDFDEGLYIDYRRFDALNITPRYEFGFGLSYTTFNYTNITVSKVGANTAPYPTTPIASGGRPDLWDVIASVDALVQNTGSMDAQEVAQLYVEIPVPNTPKRQLRGFSKINVPKGTSQNFHFDLTRKDLSIWDTEAQEWKLSSGNYRIFVGASSRILPLEATLTI